MPRSRRGGFETRPYTTRPYTTRPYTTRPYTTRPRNNNGFCHPCRGGFQTRPHNGMSRTPSPVGAAYAIPQRTRNMDGMKMCPRSKYENPNTHLQAIFQPTGFCLEMGACYALQHCRRRLNVLRKDCTSGSQQGYGSATLSQKIECAPPRLR